MRRVLLVGESNLYSSDPEDALLPWPREASGNRLREILEMSDNDYLRAFVRRNLLPFGEERCGVARAAECAQVMVDLAYREDVAAIVALGRRVADALARCLDKPKLPGFGTCEFAALRGGALGTRVLLHLPHPSGRNLIWNDARERERARDLVRGLLG